MNKVSVGFILVGFIFVLSACGSNPGIPSALTGLPGVTPTPTQTPTPAPAMACATDYALIPANATLSTSEFCLAKYEMKLTLNDGTPVFDGNNAGTAVDPTLYKPESRAHGIPWVRISHSAAIAECASLGSGYHLVTAKEHQAAARNIESVASNWAGGSVGSGFLYRGHSDNAVSATSVADGHSIGTVLLLSAGTGTDHYAGTGQSSGDALGSGGEQRRTYTLTSGEVIWDLSGNARDKVDADGVGGALAYTGAGSSTYFETTTAEFISMLGTLQTATVTSFAMALFSPATAGVTNPANYTGRYFFNSGARTSKVMSRGGNFDVSKAGLFSGDFDDTDSNSSSSGGFRCAK